MPEYTLTFPDGSTRTLTAPRVLSDAELKAYGQKALKALGYSAPKAANPLGFKPDADYNKAGGVKETPIPRGVAPQPPKQENAFTRALGAVATPTVEQLTKKPKRDVAKQFPKRTPEQEANNRAYEAAKVAAAAKGIKPPKRPSSPAEMQTVLDFVRQANGIPDQTEQSQIDRTAKEIEAGTSFGTNDPMAGKSINEAQDAMTRKFIHAFGLNEDSWANQMVLGMIPAFMADLGVTTHSGYSPAERVGSAANVASYFVGGEVLAGKMFERVSSLMHNMGKPKAAQFFENLSHPLQTFLKSQKDPYIDDIAKSVGKGSARKAAAAPKPTEPVPTPIDHQRPPTTIEEAMAGGSANAEPPQRKPLRAAAHGEPIVADVYHGSPDIRFAKQFDPASGVPEFYRPRPVYLTKDAEWLNDTWFTDDPAIAATYADDSRAFDYQNAEPGVLKRTIALQNPKVIDMQGRKWNLGESTKEANQARMEGYDGVVFKNIIDPHSTLDGKGKYKKYSKPATTVVVFDPKSIHRDYQASTPPKTIEEAMAGGTRRFTSTSDLLDAAARGEVEPNTVHDIGGQSVLFDYAPSGAPMIGTPVPGERLIHKAWREIAESQSDAVADDWLRKNGIDPAGVKANPNTPGTPPKTIEEAMAPPRPTDPVPTPVEQGGAGANPTVSEPPTAGPAAGAAEPGRTTAHADTDAVRVLAGWDPRQTNPETIAQWMEESKAHAGKEAAIADSIREKPRQAKPSEEAALGLRLNKLLEERKAAMDAGDAVAFDLADSEARKIADALDISGSEWGRQGVARQIVLKTDYTDFGLKRRAEKALDGKAAPKGLDERLAAMSQRIEDLEQKLREAIAKKESPMRPARGSVEDIRARRADALERLKANAGKAVAETLTAPVNIITGVGGAGSGGRYTAEAFQALVDLAGTYVDEGILAAKDLALKLKGHGLQGFTEKDFAQAAKEALGKKASQANRGRVAYGEDILAAGKWAVQDPEIAKMRFELDRAKWEADKALHRLEPKSVWHHVISVANLPRAMIGSIDLSAPGRQGWLGGMVNPSQWAKAWSAQMKAVKGPAEAHAAWSKIADDPDFSLFKRHGLEYNEPGGPLGSGEEMLRGNLLGQLDFRFNPYAAGERGFNEFLNTQRHGMMKTWVRWLKNWKGELTAGDLDGLANFANVLTGRGGASVPGFKNAAEFLSLGIWSPKLIASRMELLVGQPIFKRGMSKQGRLLIAGEYAKMLAMLATVSGIAYTAARNLFGKDNVVFGTDRHSSDFGKLIIRDPATNEWTRIDLGAGALQMLGFGNKAIDLKRTNAKGETKDLGNDYGESLEKEIGKFYRTKANPFIGAAWSLHTGKDPVGDPYGPKEAATGLLAPLSASELIAGWRKDGLSRADALGLLNWFGIGVNTYKTPPAR